MVDTALRYTVKRGLHRMLEDGWGRRHSERKAVVPKKASRYINGYKLF